MLLLIIIAGQFLSLTESRVFCQDTQARPWQTLGPSCPVNCANVRTAVQRLRIIDYKNIFYIAEMQYANESDPDFDIIETIMQNFTKYSEERRANELPQKHNNNINTETMFKELKKVVKLAGTVKICPQNNKAQRIITKCTDRDDFENDLLGKVNDILSTAIGAKFPFTKSLSNIIVKKLTGDNLNLRYGVVDVTKLLEHIKSAILYQERHMDADSRPTITLTSRHCLSVYVSGCFCNAGFVEESGQCVKPESCFQHMKYKEYLSRVIVN